MSELDAIGVAALAASIADCLEDIDRIGVAVCLLRSTGYDTESLIYIVTRAIEDLGPISAQRIGEHRGPIM